MSAVEDGIVYAHRRAVEAVGPPYARPRAVLPASRITAICALLGLIAVAAKTTVALHDGLRAEASIANMRA